MVRGGRLVQWVTDVGCVARLAVEGISGPAKERTVAERGIKGRLQCGLAHRARSTKELRPREVSLGRCRSKSLMLPIPFILADRGKER